MSIRSRLTGVLIFVALVSVVAALVIASSMWDQSTVPAARVEVLRFILQVVLATVVGTLGSLLVAEFNRERAATDRSLERIRAEAEKSLEEAKQRHRAALAFVAEMLQRITRTYHGVKGLRRIVRGRFRHTNGMPELRQRTYRWFIDILNRRQLEFEGIIDELEQRPGAFQGADEVIDHLRSVEERLRRVISEYVDRFPALGEAPWIALSRLPELELLLRRSDAGSLPDAAANPFKAEVRTPIRAIRMLLRDELLHSTLDPQQSPPSR